MKTAVILAGGLGTRLRPLTLETPKAMIDIDDKNLTEHVIILMKRAGAETVYLSIGYLADKIKEFFGEEYEGVRIKYLVEKDPLGTGGWMHLVDKEDFQEDFIVVNGDDLADIDFADMKRVHDENDALITLSLFEVDDPRTYGVADLDNARIRGFVEKPETIEDAPSNWVSHGYYIFSPKVFDLIPDETRFMLEKEVFPKVASINKLFSYKNRGQWFTTNDMDQWTEAKNNWIFPE